MRPGDVVGQAETAQRDVRRHPLLARTLPQGAGQLGLDQPGRQAFTRMSGASSKASCRVMWSTAALVTLYQPMPGSTPSPPMEATLMTDPRSPAFTA